MYRPDWECWFCGKKFERRPGNPNRRFCAEHANGLYATCIECESTFIASAQNKQFCSDECRERWRVKADSRHHKSIRESNLLRKPKGAGNFKAVSIVRNMEVGDKLTHVEGWKARSLTICSSRLRRLRQFDCVLRRQMENDGTFTVERVA